MTTDEDKKEKARQIQREYHANRVEAGMKRMSVWVPSECVDDFKKTVARKQRQWHKEGHMV